MTFLKIFHPKITFKHADNWPCWAVGKRQRLTVDPDQTTLQVMGGLELTRLGPDPSRASVVYITIAVAFCSITCGVFPPSSYQLHWPTSEAAQIAFISVTLSEHFVLFDVENLNICGKLVKNVEKNPQLIVIFQWKGSNMKEPVDFNVQCVKIGSIYDFYSGKTLTSFL